MAWIFSASQNPATAPEAMWMVKNLMVSGGWEIFSSSNGTVLSAGDAHPTSTTLANANAYFCARQPQGATSSMLYGGVRREFGFQRVNTNLIWRFVYGYGGLNQTGTATLMPSSSDRQFLLGSTAAGVSLFATDATYRWHIAVETTSPYSVWASAVPNGGGTPTTAILFEPMLSGTFSTLDTDPYVYYVANTNAWLSRAGTDAGSTNALHQAVSSSALNQSPKCWLAKGTGSESWTGVGALGYVTIANNLRAEASPTGLGTNPLTGNDDILPVVWAKASSIGGTTGYKGVGQNMRYNANTRASSDTLSTTSSGSKDYIVFRDIVLGWNGSSPAI